MHGSIRLDSVGRGVGRTLVPTVDMVKVGTGTAWHIVGPEEGRTVCGKTEHLHDRVNGCDPRAQRVAGLPVCGTCRVQLGQVPAPMLATDDTEGGATMPNKTESKKQTTKSKDEGLKDAVAKLHDELLAKAEQDVPGYALVSGNGTTYDRITDGNHTLVYVTVQKRGLRLDFPRPGGKYEGVKVATTSAIAKAVAKVVAEAKAVQQAKAEKDKAAEAKAKAAAKAKPKKQTAKPAAKKNGNGNGEPEGEPEPEPEPEPES